jgi:hypothetical protein
MLTELEKSIENYLLEVKASRSSSIDSNVKNYLQTCMISADRALWSIQQSSENITSAISELSQIHVAASEILQPPTSGDFAVRRETEAYLTYIQPYLEAEYVKKIKNGYC